MNLNLVNNYFLPSSILDIGAHFGEFYSLARMTFPEADILSIEGNKDCEPFLQSLNINYLICLLSKNDGFTTFYKTKKDSLCTGNSIYKEKSSNYDDLHVIEETIQTHTLDNLFFNKKIFDLIKIDTQGSELDILIGGSNIVSNAKGIILEVSFKPYNEGAPLYEEVYEFMKNIGFIERETLSVTQVYSGGVDIDQRDILFTR